MTRWTTVGNAQMADGVMQRHMMAFLEVQEKLYDGSSFQLLHLISSKIMEGDVT